MKVDGLAVILAIILLPIILVVTYYIQLQVDTISRENTYNTNLLNATYDAMSAFEINTANEKLSSVADSMRSIVQASNNVFFNTLATNFGISNASKEVIQPYIPAVLYTMYDGYYIYAPTETEKVAEKTEDLAGHDELKKTTGYVSVGDDGTEGLGGVYGDIVYEKEDGSYTINKGEAKKETNYVLKSYIQYSARYINATKDFTINYTLDNYLNIVGTIGTGNNKIYYTKTGYLIKNGLVQSATIAGKNYDLATNNEDDIKNKILGVKTNTEVTTITAADSASVVVNGITLDSNFKNIKDKVLSMTGESILTISEAEIYLDKIYEEYNNGTSALLGDIQYLENEIQNCKAVAYYASSACFSNWVYNNLSDLTFGNIIDTSMTGYYLDKDGNLKNYNTTSGAGASDLFYNFHDSLVSSKKIFIDSEHPDPEDTESNFNIHKMEVIKNSIKYNLNLAMSAYSKMEHPYECSLPILLDEEWDKILNNISIVSFMQGWDCGLDVYNNYQIVSSTNNELTVTPSEIYYVRKNEFNNSNGNYHRIDCKYLNSDSNNSEYMAFKSKEVKYDKVYDKTTGKYNYDHKNLACYTCINTNNYKSLFKPKSDTTYYANGKKYTSYYDRVDSLNDLNLRKAGYIGIAKERQDIYKTNALPVSEGHRIVYSTETNITNSQELSVSCEAKKVKKLQITISDTKSANTTGTREAVLKLTINVNGAEYPLSLNLDQKKEQTLTIDVSNIEDVINKIKLTKTLPNYNVTYIVKSIKAIYK